MAVKRRKVLVVTLVAVLSSLPIGWAIQAHLAKRRAVAHRSVCITSLKQIGVYLALYESKYHVYPTYAALEKLHGIRSSCPECGQKLHEATLLETLDDQSPPDTPVMWTDAGDGYVNVLFFQGRVDSISGDPATLSHWGIDKTKPLPAKK